MTGFWNDAEVIHSYTRAQAIADGVLVDLSESEECRESGYKFPIACTRAVWDLIEPNDKEAKIGQSTAGRLWDVLQLLKVAWKRHGDVEEGERVEFQVIFVVAPPREGVKIRGQRTERLVFVVGGGDDGEPCVTIMLPHED